MCSQKLATSPLLLAINIHILLGVPFIVGGMKWFGLFDIDENDSIHGCILCVVCLIAYR